MAAASPSSPLTVYEDASTFQALVWVPPDHTEQPLPVLIHLHGAGEAGRNVWGILAQGQTGTPLVELHHGRAPAALAQRFCVVGPQSPSSRWDESKVASFAAHLVTHPPVGVTVDVAVSTVSLVFASTVVGVSGMLAWVGDLPDRLALTTVPRGLLAMVLVIPLCVVVCCALFGLVIAGAEGVDFQQGGGGGGVI